MIIKCIVVEDEPVSMDLLESYISDTPFLDLTGMCRDAFEAGDLLKVKKVDLMFLDINMPKLSGMSFLKTLNNPPLVIFTTAYPEYAIESYEMNAVDYLMKPFSFERFIKAANKAYDRISAIASGNQGESYIMLKADKKIYKIPVNEITHLEAMGDYVKVFYSDVYILVHDTLQGLLDEIGSQEIIRVHRSWAVSNRHISFVEGNQVIVNSQEIPIGKSYREDFFNRIDKG